MRNVYFKFGHELWPMDDALVAHLAAKSDEPAVFKRSLLVVLLANHDVDYGPLSFLVKGPLAALPKWADRIFMVNPDLWPHNVCALTNRTGENTALGYLRACADGIFFHAGNMLLDDAAGSLVSVEEIEKLHDDGWRVD